MRLVQFLEYPRTFVVFDWYLRTPFHTKEVGTLSHCRLARADMVGRLIIMYSTVTPRPSTNETDLGSPMDVSNGGQVTAETTVKTQKRILAPSFVSSAQRMSSFTSPSLYRTGPTHLTCIS